MGTSMNLGQLMQPAQASVLAPEEAGMGQQRLAMQQGEMNAQGIQQGMALAQHAQNLEAKKVELEQQKTALEQGKWDSMTGMLNSLNRAGSDQMRKAMLPQLKKRLERVAPEVDPSILDMHASDEEMRRQFAAFSKWQSDKSTDPAAKAEIAKQGMMAAQQLESWGMKLDHVYQMGKTEATIEGMKAGKAITADAGMYKADRMAEATQGRVSQRNEVIHGNITKDIYKATEKQLTQFNNLDNAVSNFHNGTAPTPESFADMQQAVIANLGIKGNSGIQEREERRLKGIGLKAAEVMQFLSMKPQDINKFMGAPFAEHIIKLAQNEQQNIRQQVDRVVQSKMAAHKSFYDKNPDLKSDAEHFVDLHGKGFTPLNSAPPAEAASSLVNSTASTGAPSNDLLKRQQEFKAKASALVKKDGSKYSEAEINALMPKQ